MSLSIAMPTCNPTPVRNPARTVRERKSARNPSLKMRASSRIPAVSSHADQRDKVTAAGHGHRGYRACENGRRGRVGGHHQMARRAEHREGNERQEQGVKAGDHGHAGDAGIAQHLRDVDRRKVHAGEAVAHDAAAVERAKALEEA
jgi:hypothetical protein